MQIDEFLEIVKRRRDIRLFKPDPIPDEYVEKIIEAARWAMSGGNGQPWEFIVVKDQETREKIVEIYLEARKHNYALETTRTPELRHGSTATDSSEIPGFAAAPVLIVVCGDRRTFLASVMATHLLAGGGGAGSTYMKNMANATQNLHLAAAALGLGAQWISVHNMEEPLKQLLDVPYEIEIHTIVPIGYPARVPQVSYRRELKELIHHDRYDRSRFRSSEDVVNFIQKLRERKK